MKSTTTGTISGCIVWIIVFGVISSCMLPAAMMIGGFTSASSLAIKTLAPMICPKGTTGESYSYQTTTTDDYGNPEPATAYELHCVDANGEVIKKDPILYAFLWMGIIAVIGLILAGLLAFALAAPAGVLIARLFNRGQKPAATMNIEPR